MPSLENATWMAPVPLLVSVPTTGLAAPDSAAATLTTIAPLSLAISRYWPFGESVAPVGDPVSAIVRTSFGVNAVVLNTSSEDGLDVVGTKA